ncbi:MAG: D-arabinono-1,4-lactone oxidase [Pseudomonadales bacterium]
MSDGATWQNWSGGQQYRPHKVSTPGSLSALRDLAGLAERERLKLRCVGSGHSFVPFWTDGIIVSLDTFTGIHRVDAGSHQVSVGAGTKIHELGPLLWTEGLSLPQQGDIDRQSIAGALSTGTHGTGRTLPNLSHALLSAQLVTASGEALIIDAERTPDWLRALRVSVGLLGVLTEVTLQVEPAFLLHERKQQAGFEEVAATLEDLIADHRHCEFFWTPRSDSFEMKTLHRSTDTPGRISATEIIGPAHEIFPSSRETRFNEMEYSVPYESGWSCFTELRELLLSRFAKLPWPIEYRTLAADDAWLSTASDRESVTLSVHQGAERDHRPLFDAAESVFRNHRGRPHWGKLHTLNARDLADLYPHFEAFRRVRAELDPTGIFCNDYLAGLFDVHSSDTLRPAGFPQMN